MADSIENKLPTSTPDTNSNPLPQITTTVECPNINSSLQLPIASLEQEAKSESVTDASQSSPQGDVVSDDSSSRKSVGSSSSGSAPTAPRRSKRLSNPVPSPTSPTKPSSAILQAKLEAQKRKKALQLANEMDTIIIKDHLQPARDSKNVTRGKTGIIYDERMTMHRCLWDENYPERPERFSAILNRCDQLDLLSRCTYIQPRSAAIDEIQLLHSSSLIEKLKLICNGSDKLDKSEQEQLQGVDLDKMEDHAADYDAVYFHPSTYDLSLLATGCTIDLVNSILDGKIQNGMAIVRPPGHHAMESEYCGYCYFNNVALAAKQALNSRKAKRILIVDYEVHHGQATQQMFYNDPRVLYFSTHRFENGLFWPNLEESNFHYMGVGGGKGYNCNVPLNKIGMSNSEFLSIWFQLLLPMAYQFNPDLVIVSAGYDAALGCYEGEMEVTPQCYPHLLWPLLNLANGKMAVILEGGYCLKSLAEGAALSLRALLGDPCPIIPKIKDPMPEVADSVLNCTYLMKPHWPFLIGQKEGKADTHEPIVKFEWTEPRPAKYDTRNCYPTFTSDVTAALDERLDRLILTTKLTKSPHAVGLVYDNAMLTHRNLADPGHPECPERISNIFACHADFGLLERCLRITSRLATEDELLLLHSEDHIKRMKLLSQLSARDLHKLGHQFNSVFFHTTTYDAALRSAGSVLEVVDNVMNDKCQAGIAIVRPPGHHAEADEPCGFCIFNNVALAAKYAIDNHGLGRVLILDWDIHHGNGIQRMFEDDPRVLYISIHRYDHGAFFPCSTDANYDVVGKGAGTGFNVNIPWNRSGMSDTEYLSVFTNVIMPISYEFAPQLVLVSAGFDAAKGDPLGGCRVTPEGYAHMTRFLSGLANGKVILALEGGYNLTSIAYSMALCTKALLGDPIPPLTLKKEIDSSAIESIHNVLSIQSKYWSVLRPFRKLLPESQKLITLGTYGNKDEIDSMENLIGNLKLEDNSTSTADSTPTTDYTETPTTSQMSQSPSQSEEIAQVIVNACEHQIPEPPICKIW